MSQKASHSRTQASGLQTSLEELMLLKADARGFSFLPRQPVHSLLAGRHASRLRGRGLLFEELRRYAQGDDVRTIDWKATARLRTPYIRVYNEERERPVYLTVDQRSSMFFGSRRAMKSVVAAQLAGLAAWRTLETGDCVGGTVFGDEELVELRPHRSQTALLRLFHQVVRMNQQLASGAMGEPSDTAGGMLNRALEATLRRAKHDALVVLISDLDGADHETRRLATQIAAHNDLLVVGIYDPLGAALRGQPGMVAHDRGSHYVVPEGEQFAQTFQRQFEVMLDHWQQVFRSLKVPVIPISTAIPPVTQLRTFFGTRFPTGSNVT